MRILLDCRMAGWSGVGRYTTGLARALAKRDDVDLVEVCAPGKAPPVAAGPRVQIVTGGAHPFRVGGALELGRLAREQKPDVVHCPHFPTPFPSRRPLVVTLHDLIPLVVPGVMESTLKRIAYRRWNARATRLADRIVVPSQATAADIRRVFPAAGGKLVVTAEAADDLSSVPIRPLEGALACLASPPYLLAMGNTKPHKDLSTLLRAFERLAPAEPGLRLLLAGTDAPEYLGAHLAAAPPGVRDRVAFTGVLGDDDLRALYAEATALVVPSRYEGFGLPALEAMALGLPVVCADAASLPEVVGEAALLFPAGDATALGEALARILSDEMLQESLAEAGRKRAARFTWERTAASTIAAYEEAVRDSGRGRTWGSEGR